MSDATAASGGRDASPLTMVWAARGRVGLFVLACGLVAGGTALLLPKRQSVEVQISVGAIDPVGSLEDPEELMHRLSSQHILRTILAAEGVELKEEVLRSGDISFEARRLPKTSIVTFDVEGDDRARLESIADGVARHVLAEHQALFERVRQFNRDEIRSVEAFLREHPGEASCLANHREAKTSGAIGTTFGMGPDRSGLAEQIYLMRRYLTELRERILPPKARATRIVFGPEVPVSGRLSPLRAAFMGVISGLLLVFAWASLRRGRLDFDLR